MVDKKIIEDIISDVLNKSSIVDTEKCSKPHITGLPYDLRTTSLTKLTERYNACLDEMNKRRDVMNGLRDDIRDNLDLYHKERKTFEDLVSTLKQFNEDNQKFDDADEKVLEEKKRWLNSIRDRMNFDVVIKEELRNRIEHIEDLLGNSSWVNTGNQNYMMELANDIIDWRYTIEQDDNEWGNIVDGIADDIRVIASNDYFDKNLPNLYANIHTNDEIVGLQDDIVALGSHLQSVDNTLTNLENELTKEQNDFQDIYDESQRTLDRGKELLKTGRLNEDG